MGGPKQDLPIAFARSPWLGIGMVAAGVVFRNEALVTRDNRERIFLVAVGRGLDAVLKEEGGRYHRRRWSAAKATPRGG
jgi:hypothetical protein